MSDRFAFQRGCAAQALAELDGLVINCGCCDDGNNAYAASNGAIDNRLKPLDPARVINCDISAVDELYEDPDDDTRVTGTRPTAAEVIFDAARDRWPFDDGSACLVVLGDILEHLSPDDIQAALTEARRVSRRLCITVPEDTRATNTPERADQFRRGHVHRTVVTERLLREKLKAAGWKIHRWTLVPDYDNSSQFWGQQVGGHYVEAEQGRYSQAMLHHLILHAHWLIHVIRQLAASWSQPPLRQSPGMPLTGTLGTPLSQPGQLQPGYAIVQGKAQWLGPFNALVTGIANVRPGETITVSPTVAQELAASDPSWWSVH